MSAQTSNRLGSTTGPKTKPIVYSTKKALEDNIIKRINEMAYYIYEIVEPASSESVQDSAENTGDMDENEDEDNPQFSGAEFRIAIKDLIACIERMPLQAGLDSDFMALGGKICQQIIPSSLLTFHKGVIYKMLAEITTSCLDLQMRLQDPEFDIVRLKYLILALEKEGTKIAMIESAAMREMLERMEKFKAEKGKALVPEPNWDSLFSFQTSELVGKCGEHGMYVGLGGDFA